MHVARECEPDRHGAREEVEAEHPSSPKVGCAGDGEEGADQSTDIKGGGAEGEAVGLEMRDRSGGRCCKVMG